MNLFAILQISDSNTIFKKPQIQSQRITLPSGDAFFTVTTDKHYGKIPWKKLKACLGILRNNILLPEDITIPEDVNITKFIPDILPRLILMNSRAFLATEMYGLRQRTERFLLRLMQYGFILTWILRFL